MASAAFAFTSGPYCARPVTPSGASPVLISPHPGHCFAATWYSITSGGGGGEASNTCRFCGTPSTGSPVRSCPQQPHAAGPQNTVWPGSGDCFSVEDGAPGCLPGLRPDWPRSDRSFGFFVYGLSDEGGLEEVDESLSRRRRSSSTCAASAASCAAASSSRARAASRSRALTASSSATRARSHASSSDAGGWGVPGTSRTLPQPVIRHQLDTPSRPATLPQPQPGQQRPHRSSLRLNSYLDGASECRT